MPVTVPRCATTRWGTTGSERLGPIAGSLAVGFFGRKRFGYGHAKVVGAGPWGLVDVRAFRCSPTVCWAFVSWRGRIFR